MYRGLLLVCAAALAALTAPSSAHAASLNCEASALRLALAGLAPQEPAPANAGNTTCVPADFGGGLPATPLPLTGGGVFAHTGLTGSDPLSQVATASAGIGDLTLTSLLPGIPAPDLSALPGGGVFNVPGIGTVDIRPALNALVQPTGPLLHASALKAETTARCSSGNPSLTGSSSVASLSVLGFKLPVDEEVDRVLQAVDSQSLDPSNIDISKVIAPTADLTALQLALQPVLDALPAIAVPPAEVHVKVTPGEQVRSGDRLTRRALHVVLSGGTTTILDAVIGEATVDATGVSCGSVAAAALGLGRDSRCTTRRITLIDVLQRGNRVVLDGAADPRRFAGKRVRIVSNWDKHTVARPKVAKSGLFHVSLPLPPASIRHTNLARYMATIGKEHSLNLKLERRMVMTSAKALGHRRVRLVGQVALPLATPVRPIAIKRRVSCGTMTTIARVTPDSTGRFSVTLKGPAKDRVYTFRFQTVVRHLASGRSLMETFTLPRYVLGT